ncbi:MAG: BlaI/MecI/CopY family transcriptional regulator [Planctomycetota bacterium]|jgi:predicted transcriptional regulator
MTTKRTDRLTPLESRIMDSVWELSSATVRQVQEHLQPTRPMAYNTVLTMMRILRQKGFLRSERKGRADMYTPCVSRRQVARRSLHELVERFFAGSPSALVSQLIDDADLSPEQIRAIRREVDSKLGG